MGDETVMAAKDAQLVVLAGSALRSAPLEAMAETLRRHGARVEVVAGVDRRRVDLLKLSFQHRDRAAYLILGGPALREDVVHSIVVELEVNGVPSSRISSGPCQWEDPDRLGPQALERLRSLGIPLEPALPSPSFAPPRPTIPSTQVATLPPEPDPTPPRRVPAMVWAAAGVALSGALVFALTSVAPIDAAASELETALASVATAPRAEPAPVDVDEDVDAIVLPERTEPEPEPELVVPDSPAEDADLVYAALESQSIRALDILLVSPSATTSRGKRSVIRRASFSDAQAYCRDLEIDGVARWRLPDVGEAQWLSRGNMIRTGVYWTSTKSDPFGDSRVTWNPRSKRMRSTAQRWRGGRAVCVRFSKNED